METLDHQAEDAFLEYLTLRESQASTAFADYAAAHPEIQERLLSLYDDWRKACDGLEQIREQSAVASTQGNGGSGPGSQGAGNGWSTALLRHLALRRVSGPSYRVCRAVAEGAMGKIWKVWDGALNRHVAMKKLRTDGPAPGTPSGSRSLARFVEEAQVTGQLEHPGIVPVHELNVDGDGQIYFTMRLIHGRSFREVIDLVHKGKEDWTLRRALRVMLKVCEAVAFAHSKNVIHRDLKPSNVMVGRYGEAYVVDWGLAGMRERDRSRALAKIEDSSTGTTPVFTARRGADREDLDQELDTLDGDVVGTPSYMAPEQAQGRIHEVGVRSDVYALGAVLYHLLAGHMPYVRPGTRASLYTILNAVRTGPPEPLREVAPEAPVELVEICEKAMARDKRRRYRDTLALAKDLEAWLDHRPVEAHGHSLGYALKLAMQRNRLEAATLAVALVAVLALGGVSYYQHHQRLNLAEAGQRETEHLLGITMAPLMRDREEELPPPVPWSVGEYAGWLHEVDWILPLGEAYRRELEGFEDRGDTGTYEYRRLRRAVLAISDLERLRPEVQARLDTAMTLVDRTITDQEEAWAQVIRSLRELDQYDTVDLTPQVGLIPLGINAKTKLWEFWHFLSGDRPDFDPDSGGYVVKPGSGMVLVLIPPGSEEAGTPAFFLSKYEVTQDQWERVMRYQASLKSAGVPMEHVDGYPDRVYTDQHPVETVDWKECRRFVERLDLRLPRLEEWEHAARAGSVDSYHWGDSWSDLEGQENVRDQSCSPLPFERAPWNDGYVYHAPVGSFKANAFGLYDMLGNVSEWCADPWDESAIPDRPEMSFRGGSWYLPLDFDTVSYVQHGLPGVTNHMIGLRPARELRGEG